MVIWEALADAGDQVERAREAQPFRVQKLVEARLEHLAPLEVRKPGIFITRSFIKVTFSMRFVTILHDYGGC